MLACGQSEENGMRFLIALPVLILLKIEQVLVLNRPGFPGGSIT